MEYDIEYDNIYEFTTKIWRDTGLKKGGTIMEKTGNEFFYYKEIREQPLLFEMLYRREAEKIKEIVQKLQKKMIKQVIFTGCGDAYDNAVYSAQCFNALVDKKIFASAVEPFEFIHQSQQIEVNTALIVFSVKGRSKLVMEMMKELKKKFIL